MINAQKLVFLACLGPDLSSAVAAGYSLFQLAPKVKAQLPFHFAFQVIFIKESNIIAPYRNERVSQLEFSFGFPLMVTLKLVCLSWDNMFMQIRVVQRHSNSGNRGLS